MSKARGVRTNGIGNRTTAHLNLTRSLADIWGPPKPRPVVPLVLTPPPAPVPPYAGFDKTERAWRS